MVYFNRFCITGLALATIALGGCQPVREMATGGVAPKREAKSVTVPSERDKLLRFCGQRHVDHLAGKIESDPAVKEANDAKCKAVYDRG